MRIRLKHDEVKLGTILFVYNAFSALAEKEKRKMVKHFKDETVTNASVKEALERIKSK